MPIAIAGNQITFNDGSTLDTGNININRLVYTNGTLGFRNKILNGYMGWAQRRPDIISTPFLVASNTSYYLFDRYQHINVGSGSFNVSQNLTSDTVQTGQQFSMRTTTVAADALPATNNHYNIVHRLEKQDVYDLRYGTNQAQTTTFSFWVKSNLPGSHCVRFLTTQDTTPTFRSYVTLYTISLANTWEYKTITIPGDTTTGILGSSNNPGWEFRFGLGSGSARTTNTLNQWIDGTFDYFPGAIRPISTIGGYLELTGIQFEIGTKATPFTKLPIGLELQALKRYYEKSYNYSNVPGTITSVGCLSVRQSATSNFLPGPFSFFVRKRTTPTLTIYNPHTGTANSVKNDSVSPVQNPVVAATPNLGEGGWQYIQLSSGGLDGSAYNYHYTADAEL